MTNPTNDELRGKLSEIVRYNGFNLSNDEAVDALLQLIHKHTEQAVREARIDEIRKANTLLQPPHMVNSGSDYTRMDTWFKDRIAQLTINPKGGQS